MGYDDYLTYEEGYAEEIAMEELYQEHIEEFTPKQLYSYYAENPLVAEAPLRALQEAREFLGQGYYSAAFVFASTRI